jgi:ribosomal protein L17
MPAAAPRPDPRPRVVKKLFDELAPRYQSRQGGYTRS